MATSGRRFHIGWPSVAAALALTLSVLRAINLEQYADYDGACSSCFTVPALGHDAWLLSASFVLLGLQASVQRRGLARLCGALAAGLIVLMALDVALLSLLDQRLYLGDLLRFASGVQANWSVIRPQLLAPGGIGYAVGAALVIASLVGLLRPAAVSGEAPTLFVLAGIALLFAIAVNLQAPLLYKHEQYTWNVVAANLPQGHMRAFSDAYARRELKTSQTWPETCTHGEASGRNVVIVMTESLSAYQSALLGGPRDWLPQLDALARANHYFTHFYANGFATDGGEIAVLTGHVPIAPAGAPAQSLAAFGPEDSTLPALAHSAGYAAYYFTTADLAFLDSGSWLHGLGFDGVEGNENPFYADLPRGQFGAAEDAALFARFAQWLDARHDARPFIAVLLTVSSHPPFANPRDGKIDAEATFHYVDDQLAAFHHGLAGRGFFDNGVLLITGDHRSMTPLLEEEYRQFGERAFARIPLIVAGSVTMPNVVETDFQQSDIPGSIAQLLGVEYCHTAFNGQFLTAAPRPAEYVVHVRGDDRNRVDVYFGDRVASYREDGDTSNWMTPTLPPAANAVAAWIDAQRVPRPTSGAAGGR
jgi:phosphoglycerol transferase MdoB-like AlkP superfamily enzyme